MYSHPPSKACVLSGVILRISNIRTGVANKTHLLVKVETDAGIYGWGESGLSGRELGVIGIVDHYREFLIGRDPMQRGALWQEMYRSQYFEGGRVLAAAISAIDIALYDITGKALRVPVYELLGGRQRDFVDVIGTATADSTNGLIEQGQMMIDGGWKAFRLFPDYGTDVRFEPRESIAKTAERFAEVRSALGRKIVLGTDYHTRLSVAEAASFIQMLPVETLDFIEEPIRDESPEAYESLRRMVDIPFAIGEEFSSKWQFLPFIERGLTNYARVDVCNVGGLTEAVKVAGWAEAHYIDLMPHSPLGPVCTAAAIHLCAASPNVSWLESWRNPWSEDPRANPDVYPPRLNFSEGRFEVPDAPGLGVDVDESKLMQEFELSEPPHLRRYDGSFTNW